MFCDSHDAPVYLSDSALPRRIPFTSSAEVPRSTSNTISAIEPQTKGARMITPFKGRPYHKIVRAYATAERARVRAEQLLY
jgi:hypothetical protein